MTERPIQPNSTSRPDETSVEKQKRSSSASAAETAKSSTETARAVDSAPAAVGSFAAGRFAKLPVRFGRYEVRRELGRGQMGAVYLAHDLELDRPVALKVARVSASGSAKLLQRMQVEAKAAARIDHPLICKVYDAGEIDDVRFIALQYVDGEDVKKYMKRTGRRLEPAEAVRLVMQILGALEAAHEKGIIHRDLKPENVMLNSKHEPVIMDFGLARSRIASTNAGLTQGMIVGTAAYMSPEQATGKAEGIDHRSDLYAVGVMLFEMLTGDWPFNGAAIEVMGKKCVQEPPTPRSLNPKLNQLLSAVCHRMIARKKEDRFETCAKAIEALGAIDLTEPIESNDEIYLLVDEPFFVLESPPVAARIQKKPQAKPAAKKSPSPKALPAKTSATSNQRNIFSNPRPWLIAGSGLVLLVCITIPVILLLPKSASQGRSHERSPIVADRDQKPVSARTNEQSHPKQEVETHSNRDSSGRSNKPFPAEADAALQPLVADKSKPTSAGDPAEPESQPSEPAEAESVLMTESEAQSQTEPTPDLGSPAETASNPGNRPQQDLGGLIAAAGARMQAAKVSKGKEGAVAFKEATTLLKKASNLYPKELQGDFYLGILHSGIGVNDTDTAELHFKRVLDRSPGHVATMNNLALVSIRAKKFRQAQNFLGLAGKSSPRPFEVNQNLGRLVNQAQVLEIKNDEIKRIKAIHTEPAAYRADTGWMYMPLDLSAQSREEYKSFCRSEKLEDQSCSICSGYGSVPCKTCGRQGAIVVMGQSNGSFNTLYGSVATSTPTTATLRCATCGGRGRVDCHGCVDGHDPSLPKQ